MKHGCTLRSQRLSNLFDDLSWLFDPIRPSSEQWAHIVDEALLNVDTLPETMSKNRDFTLPVIDIKIDNHAVRAVDDEATICGMTVTGLIIVILDENPKELVNCDLCIAILDLTG